MNIHRWNLIFNEVCHARSFGSLLPIIGFFLCLGRYIWEATCDNLQMLGRFCLIDALCAKGILNQRIIYCFTLDVSCLGISRVASDCIKNHLLAWEGFFGRKVKKKKAALVLPYIIFGVFGEREKHKEFLRVYKRLFSA